MSPSNKADAVTGIVTVTLGAISGSFTAADLHEWGTTFMSLSPFVLILFLIWRMHKLDSQHKECGQNLVKTQGQLLLMYHAMTDSNVRRNMPHSEDFMEGNFDANKLKSREK